jgi:hypothetical protein
MNNAITIAGAIIALTGAVLGINQVLIPTWKKVSALFNTWAKFIRDWEGEPAEAGRDAVPGVMERLNKLDGELSNNGGNSVKDKVDKLARNQDKIFKKIDDAEKQRAQVQEVLLDAIKALAENKESRSRIKKAPKSDTAA